MEPAEVSPSLLHDRFARRVRAPRLLFLCATCALAVAVPAALGFYLSDGWALALFGGLLGFAGLLKFWGELVAMVPEGQAFVTFNAFTGAIVPYGPGDHPSFPWESKTATGHLPLRVITTDGRLDAPTADDTLKLTWFVYWRLDLARLERAASITIGVIETTLETAVRQWLTTSLGTQTAREVHEDLNALSASLRPSLAQTAEHCGIVIEQVGIQELAFSSAVSTARSVVAEHEAREQIIARQLGLERDELVRRISEGSVDPKQFADA